MTILIQLSDYSWTVQALHLACSMARSQRETVTLLRLMQVRHISYLGSEFGRTPITDQEMGELLSYQDTAEDYGVEIELEQMQCLNPIDAIAEAANVLSATAVFARVPPSLIPIWHDLVEARLQYRLWRAGRSLYTLQPSPNRDQATGIQIKSVQDVVIKTS
jgi:hypothetical protein